MGFKPIFEEERQFFLKQTGIEIPTDCWRNSSKIYLDFTQNKPLIQFKVADNQIHITTDNRNGYKVKNKINLLKIRFLVFYCTNSSFLTFGIFKHNV